jgi:hypothetical protein
MAFKRTVDQLLDARFSLGFYVDRIARELGDAANNDIREHARKAILSERPDRLRRYLAGKIEDAITIDRVIAIAGVAIAAAQLWKS